MGYTHYWYRKRKIEESIMEKIVNDTYKVLSKLSIGLVGDYQASVPIINTDIILFNGLNDDAHETCVFPRIFNPCDGIKAISNNLLFDCCKTANKPYDLAVTSFLIIAKHYLKDNLIVRSDGEISDWFEGQQVVQDELGYGMDFILDEKEKEKEKE